MASETIRCPNCGTEIPLSEALQEQIREDIRSQLELEYKSKNENVQRRSEELDKKEKALKRRNEGIEEELQKRMEEERKKIAIAEKKRAEKEYELKVDDLQSQVDEKSKEVRELKKRELELSKRERELKDAQEDLELKVQRQMRKEREEIRKKAKEDAESEFELVLADQKGVIDSLKNQISDLKKKAEQGSQQAQGETLEIILEQLLREEFPNDNITPVPKGVSGGDVLHEVCDDGGRACGTIIWESKRTKNYGSSWIPKLKGDQRKAKAEVAVIVTVALPKGIDSFGHVDGVWVTSPQYAKSLAQALRLALIEVSASKAAAVGKGKKMELLYVYLSGAEFRGRVAAIVEGFEYLKKQLDKERVTMNKLWAQREKEIQKVLLNTAEMYGELQGIIGASLPEIKALELKALPRD